MDFQLDDKRLALQKAVQNLRKKNYCQVSGKDETSTFPVDAYKNGMK